MIKNFKDKILVKIHEIFSNYIKKNNFYKILYKNKTIKLLNVNPITLFRNKTFFVKEPETLEFIKQFKKENFFWDIGANVGLYSCFAAKTKSCNVYSFEPSVFNLEILARNIYENKLQKKISIIPISLSNKNSEGFFHIPTSSYGSALATFDKRNLRQKNLSFKTISLTSDFLIENNIVKCPDYIKLDVDGNEFEILKGIKKNIKKVKSIILEMDYGNRQNIDKIKNFFRANEFFLKSKNQSYMIKGSIFNKVFNEIWNNKRFK